MSTFRMTIGQLNQSTTEALQSVSAIISSVGNTAHVLNNSISHHLNKQSLRHKYDIRKYREIIHSEALVELYQLRESVAALPNTELVQQIMDELKDI